MNRKKIIILILSFIVIFLIVLFLDYKNNNIIKDTIKNSNETENSIDQEIVLDENNWESYNNTEYGYNFKYPKEANLQKSQEMESVVLEKSKSVTVGLPSCCELIEIYSEDFISVILQQKLPDTKEDLNTFANNIVKIKQSENNLFIETDVGALKKINFSSFDAYLSLVKEKTTDYAKQDALQKNIPFVSWNKEYSLLFVENSNGKKIVVKVYDNKVAKKILETFNLY